jgi:hypothetical protein
MTTPLGVLLVTTRQSGNVEMSPAKEWYLVHSIPNDKVIKHTRWYIFKKSARIVVDLSSFSMNKFTTNKSQQ